MKKEKKLYKRIGDIPGTSLFFILVAVGLIVYGIMYIAGTKKSRDTAELRMKDVASYVKGQCVLYDYSSSEEEVKSLIRIAEKTQILCRDLLLAHSIADEKTLFEFIDEQRLTGVILTDDTTGKKKIYSTESEDISNWEGILERVKNISENESYVERFVYNSEYCYDYAVVSRTDCPGTMICYMKQKRSSVNGTELSVKTLLTGYNFYTKGLVAVTDGKTIIGSSDEVLSGVSVLDCPLIMEARKIQNYGSVEEIREDTDYLAIREKVRRYFIYVFYPKSSALGMRSEFVLYTMIIYTVLAITVFAVHQLIESKRRAERIKSIEKASAERELLAKEAIKANNAKTDFLRKISHDIRTPVNGICGMLDIADYYDNDSEKRRECYEKIRRASDYLLDLVDDVIDVSKMEQGLYMLKEEAFDIEKIFYSIADIMNPKAEENGITLECTCENIIHKDLFGSALAIKRIIINLITNALKYNNKNGTVTATLKELSSDGKHARFAFICADTGIGMSKEFQKHMFEPFAQEAKILSSATYSGTGLGLAIVQKLIEQMGGTINVESETGHGTVITVNISILINDGNIPAATNKSSHSALNSNAPLKGIKALIAEDNELNTEIAVFFLENAGATAVCANSGKEAADLFAASAPGEINVILMDIMMPEMDGIQATGIIRAMKRPDAATVPIIAMTANAYPEDSMRARNYGMNEHLPKPISQQKLIETVLKVLSKN